MLVHAEGDVRETAVGQYEFVSSWHLGRIHLANYYRKLAGYPGCYSRERGFDVFFNHRGDAMRQLVRSLVCL